MTQPPVTPGIQYQPQPPQSGNGLAVASLVTGIISLVLFCVWFVSIPLGVVAAILGAVAVQKANAGQAQGGGLAKAGMILGIVGAVLGLGIVILGAIGVHFLNRGAQNLSQQLQKSIDEAERRDKERQRQQQPTSEPGTRLDQPAPWRMRLDPQSRTVSLA